jgi:hypothetical protein
VSADRVGGRQRGLVPGRGAHLPRQRAGQAIYYAPNIGVGANQVTVSFDRAAVFVDLRVTGTRAAPPAVPPRCRPAPAAFYAGLTTTAASGCCSPPADQRHSRAPERDKPRDHGAGRRPVEDAVAASTGSYTATR